MILSRRIIFAAFLLFGLIAAPLVYQYSQGNLLSAETLLPDTKTDAVMVFTGSADRVVEGYQFYIKGLTDKLMITGYDYPQEAHEPAIKKLWRQAKKKNIFIDLTARNTIENAKNGAAWALANNVQSITLITTEAHMPRAYFELRRLLPKDIVIYTNAVPGDLNYAGLDSEKGRLLCRLYETATGTSFCYQTRNIVRDLGNWIGDGDRG